VTNAEPEPLTPEIELLLHAEVERTVAPYVGIAPPAVLAKMRQLSERYWREHPAARCALRLQIQQKRVISGMGDV
jgi:hypothetical protein